MLRKSTAENRSEGQLREPTENVALISATGAIGKLARFLIDEAQIDEKIRDTLAALTLVKKRISESLVQHYIGAKEPRVYMPEELMKEEQSYERLLQALKDMKSEISKQIRPVEEQIVQASVDHLRESFIKESQRLNKCLEEIDENILACRQFLQDYENLRSALHSLNEKLSQLGAESLQVPDHLPSADLGEIVKGRIENLKSQGKI
jgi:chromosome segregation ATPase